MKKNVMLVIMVVFVYLVMPVYAQNLKSTVSVRIESHDKTLIRGETASYTFIEAVQKVADEKGISIVLKQNNDTKKIYSVNGINEKQFHSYDGWQGFIVRDGQVFQPVDIYDELLKESDEVVLYYGEPQTYKITSLELEDLGDKVILSAVSTYTRWIQNETWRPVIVNEKIAGINVHVKLPNGAEQIMRTNTEGIVKFSITMPGTYYYYAEGYTDTLPTMVKSSEMQAVWGIKDERSLTRSEFIAMLYTKKGFPIREKVRLFDDFDSSHMYSNSVAWASGQGVVLGYPDSTIRPDTKMTTLEAIIMLNNLHPDEFSAFEYTEGYEGVPLWAEKHVAFAISKGFLSRLDPIHNVVSYQNALGMLERV